MSLSLFLLLMCFLLESSLEGWLMGVALDVLCWVHLGVSENRGS